MSDKPQLVDLIEESSENKKSSNVERAIPFILVACSAIIILCMASSLAMALYFLYEYYIGNMIVRGSACKVDNAVTTVCINGKACTKNSCKDGECTQVENFNNIGQKAHICSTCGSTRKSDD